MIIDAMDLLYLSRFDGFCLVSSDSGFTRLAARIRESGPIVYGFRRLSAGHFMHSTIDQQATFNTLAYIKTRSFSSKGKVWSRSSKITRPRISLAHTTLPLVQWLSRQWYIAHGYLKIPRGDSVQVTTRACNK